MTINKKLERGSRYEAHDLDGDGTITDAELSHMDRMYSSDYAH